MQVNQLRDLVENLEHNQELLSKVLEQVPTTGVAGTLGHILGSTMETTKQLAEELIVLRTQPVRSGINI